MKKQKPFLAWALMEKSTGRVDMITTWQSRQDLRLQCDPQHRVVRVEVKVIKGK